jgi:hypothetical protein
MGRKEEGLYIMPTNVRDVSSGMNALYHIFVASRPYPLSQHRLVSVWDKRMFVLMIVVLAPFMWAARRLSWDVSR